MVFKRRFRHLPGSLSQGLRRLALAAGLFGGALAASAGSAGAEAGPAAASAWATTEHGRVRLVSAATATGESRHVTLGLQFEMRPGWKIYWRSPGDAGFPPSADWSGSRNLADATLAWPAPERFSVLGLTTLGYRDAVVLPLAATLVEPGRPVRLEGLVDYLTCDDICVPYQAHLVLELPSGPAQSTPFAHLIDRFAKRVPGDGAAAGLRLARIEVGGTPAREALEIVVAAREPFEAPDLIVEGPPGLAFGQPTVTLTPDRLQAHVAVPVEKLTDDAPSAAGTPLTVTAIDGSRSLEVSATPARAPPPAGAESRLIAILGLALLGGFILNFMPCVLPVLSIKLLGAVGHGGGEPRRVRRRFLASAAGILASFLALAAGLIALKAGGAAIGWGIQFQQPWFLIAMVALLSLFAANLWGLFEIRLPSRVATALARPGERGGLAGDFLTGALATLLATPCSAPFLGAAVGFALARGAPEIVAVFAALGIGLAAPYLLVAAAPHLVTWLPRPGPWMVKLRAILGLALAGTALWLLSVLAAQEGAAVALAVGGLAALAVVMFWVAPRAGRAGVAAPAAAALLVLGFAVPALVPAEPAATAAPPDEAGYWQAFDRTAIPGLVAAGKTVFVDVTADWCVTCKANKRLVLSREAVAGRLGSGGTVAMVADWTRPDDGIAAYLASFGRYGIPFNVVYGPGAPSGITLPELLTERTVLDALEAAGGAPARAAYAD